MNRQPGFSVIELMISIMISAMLMTAALTVYNQISKGMTNIQTLTQQDIATMIVKNRLSQDLVDLCPLWFTSDQIKKQDESPKQGEQQSAQPKESEQPKTTPENPNTQKNSYLYAQNKNNQLDYLTFITTGTLQNYVDPTYRCARVVYALKEDDKNPKLFMLQRKEDPKVSNEFDKETITQGTFYTLAKNISNCVVEFGFIDMAPAQREQQADQEWKTKWVDQWGVSSETKQSNEYTPALPDSIRIKMTIQENQEKPGKLHEFYCTLPQSKEVRFQSFAQKRYYQQRNAKQEPKLPDKNAATQERNSASNIPDKTIVAVIPKQQ